MDYKYNIYIYTLLIGSLIFSYENMPRLYFNDSNIKSNYNINNQVFKPMAMSLIIPGWGQYNQDRKTTALGFFALELSLIYLQQFYSSKGDNKVLEYEDYANKHWNFEDWILSYNDWNNPDSEYYSMFSDPEGNWQEIWSHSHYIAFEVDHPNYQGLYYTNEDNNFGYDLYDAFLAEGEGFMDEYNVTIVKDHHFYEGIRKYNMFFAGWNDADEIEVGSNGGYQIALSPNKNQYNSIWNKSIEFYDYAQYALTGIYLNHLVSALEIYIKNKFDNRFDLNVTYDYNKYSESINYSLMLSLNLK